MDLYVYTFAQQSIVRTLLYVFVQLVYTVHTERHFSVNQSIKFVRVSIFNYDLNLFLFFRFVLFIYVSVELWKA